MLCACSKGASSGVGKNIGASESTSTIQTDAPLEKYFPISYSDDVHNEGSNWILVYYALCDCTINYTEIANNLSTKYADEQNAFKKQAILDSLMPDIDTKIKLIKANRLVYFTEGISNDIKYDFQNKSFIFTNVQNSSCSTDTGVFHDHPFNSIDRTNQLEKTCSSQGVMRIPVSDQALAEKIESIRERGLKTHYYAYVESAGMTMKDMSAYGAKATVPDFRSIQLKILKVGLSERNGGDNEPGVANKGFLVQPLALPNQ